MNRASPLQNRCAPDGCLHAVAARGTLMGNRGGRIHDADGRLGAARWKSRAWIACRLEWRGWWRPVMGDGYTEIFFLDEATALAAGHRPCFLCRRPAATAFAAAWARAFGLAAPPRAPEMDAVLHRERRVGPVAVPLGTLSRGSVFVDDGFHLIGQDGPRLWSFDGYRKPDRSFDPDEIVQAVTAPSVRGVLAAGYLPELHPSVTG